MASPLQPGARIDDCTLIEQGGAGGFSLVWKARQDGREAPVALKFPRVAELTHRLRREADLLVRAADPRVVPLLEARLDGELPYLVMPWIDGEDLRLPTDVPEPADMLPALQRIADLAAVVARLHEGGLVHGDLKPGNVRVGADGKCWLLDLGLARVQLAAKQERSLAHSLVSVDGHSIAGTLDFIAPEVLGGNTPTPASDVYSLGVILHHALTGRPPAFGVDPLELNPYLPPGTVSLLGRLLHQDPTMRPADAGRLRLPLERLILAELRLKGREGGHERRLRWRLWLGRLTRAVERTLVAGVQALTALAIAWAWYQVYEVYEASVLVAIPVGIVVPALGMARINIWAVAARQRAQQRRSELRRRQRGQTVEEVGDAAGA